MKYFKIFLLLLAFLIMLLVVTFLDDVGVIDSMSASYFIVISAFLGLDIASMIKATSKLPTGQYKKAHLYRYLLTFVLTLVLFLIGIYRKSTDNLQISMSIGSFGTGCMVIIGLLLAGLEGNKIVTDKGGDQ